MAVLKKKNQKATWLKGGPPRWSWNLWNTTILCPLFQNCFPLVPLGLQRKFITLWSKFKPVPSLKHLKSWSGSADHSPASNCTCHWLSCKQAGKWCVWRRWWWGWGSRSIFCLPWSTYLSSAWNLSSVAREWCTMRTQAGELEPLVTGRWMEDLTLTWSGEENTCSAGLGSLATCGEGWEFLQREGWGDGRMEKVEEEEVASACLRCPDVNLERVVSIWFFCQRALVSCGKGLNNLRWKLGDGEALKGGW